MPGSTDPTDVNAIAVTDQDVVAAYEATRQADREAVLRVTPPFSGRMRARLHVSEVVPGEAAAADAAPDRDGPAPIEIPPWDLLDDPPEYPDPDETEDALRADPDVEYTRDCHHDHHEGTLEAWRDEVLECIVERVTIETASGPHEVVVSVLGE